jgi:hypothetical protein
MVLDEAEAGDMEVTGNGRFDLDRRLERLGAWSGVAWVVLGGAGFGGSGLVPVLYPSTQPEVLAAHVSDIKYRVLVGMLLLLIGGFTFLLTWSLTFAHQVRKYANPSPMAFAVLQAVGIIAAILAMLCGVVGTAMAFRVDTLAPETTQVLYDFIWWFFLLPWPPFMVWQLVAGFAILSDANSHVVFPRWSGYFTLWVAALEMFSAPAMFFHSGPFSYAGMVTFWVPAVSFFAWVPVMAIVQVRGLSRWEATMADQPVSAPVDGEHGVVSERANAAAV